LLVGNKSGILTQEDTTIIGETQLVLFQITTNIKLTTIIKTTATIANIIITNTIIIISILRIMELRSMLIILIKAINQYKNNK
jgi:hypothetical protein